MVGIVEGILSIEQANKLTEEDLLKLKTDGCKLVYLVDEVLIIRELIYQPEIQKKEDYK